MNQTALHIAVKKGSSEIVKFLVENGADPKAYDLLNRDCFQLAKEHAKITIMEYFNIKFNYYFPKLYH